MKNIKTEINAIQIGGLAKIAINAQVPGRVVGVTSKGIFLNSADKILFLTSVAYKSPYNIQIRQLDLLSDGLNFNEEILLAENSIIFPRQQLLINLKSAETWQPYRMKKITCSQQTQSERISAIIQRMCEIDPNKGWLFLKNCGEAETNGLADINHRIKKSTLGFEAGYKKHDLLACLKSAKSILGLGGGLTPSGDDWLTGYLLVIARVNQGMYMEDPFTADLGKALTELSFQKTTKISANRIEAACTGWAEEIFLDLIDYIFIEETKFSDTRIETLINFGHSSGVDTCMGIFAGWSIRSSE